MNGDSCRVDIILPVYNEEEVIYKFYDRLIGVLDNLQCNYRLIYVDDGSTDSSISQLFLLASQNERVVVVELSRNFGHQAALSAGLSVADGDYVILMDSDGQHPPELIPEMLTLAQNGYDLVLTQRLEQENLGLFKRWTSNLFYRIINFLSSTHLESGAADFRLLNSSASVALRSMPEYHRFLRSMVSWIGFRSIILTYIPKERIAGYSKYSLRKMVRLAMDAVFSFSLAPLFVAIFVGIIFLMLALLEISYVLSFWVLGKESNLAPGWASLMFILLLTGASILITLGIIGIYVGYIFQEVKHRPIFIIRSIHGARKVKNAD